MNQQIREVIHKRLVPVEEKIKLVAENGERNVKLRIKTGKDRRKVADRKFPECVVLVDQKAVIQDDEPVPQHRTVRDKVEQEKTCSEEEKSAFGWEKGSGHGKIVASKDHGQNPRIKHKDIAVSY